MAQSVDSEYELEEVDATYGEEDLDEILEEVQIELLNNMTSDIRDVICYVERGSMLCSGRELHIDMAWLGHPDFPAYEKVLRACYDEIKKVEKRLKDELYMAGAYKVTVAR
jgi:hypothetical protein